MSTNPTSSRRTAKVPARSIALPVEHGAWGFLFEPLAAGLLLAPGIAAPFIAVLTGGAFLTRQPLKFLLGDWLQKRSLPRTEVAMRFVLIFGGITIAGLLGIVFFGTLQSLVPFGVIAPIVVYLIIQDAARQTRQLLPEVLAAFALASSVAVLALADGFAASFALTLWAMMVARLIPSVLYVRSRLRLEKGKEFSRLAPIAAHLIALASIVGFYSVSLASLLTVLMAVFLTGRAAFGLSKYRQILKAKTIGVWEVVYGVLYALSIVVGYYLNV